MKTSAVSSIRRDAKSSLALKLYLFQPVALDMDLIDPDVLQPLNEIDDNDIPKNGTLFFFLIQHRFVLMLCCHKYHLY